MSHYQCSFAAAKWLRPGCEPVKGRLLKIRTLNPKAFVIEEVSRPQENLAHTDVFVSGSLRSITGIIRRKSWKYCNSCGADVRVLLQEFEKHQHLIMSAGIHRCFCCHVAISFESATGTMGTVLVQNIDDVM